MAIPPLVSAAWLKEHSAQVRILDARFKLGVPGFGLDCYRAGHIPGAAFVDLERDLHAPCRADRVGGRHPLPEPAQIAVVCSRLGLSNTDHMVVYDDPASGFGFYAPHLWWLLRYFGHDRVSVLDGGLPAWVASGGALETPVPSFASSSFTVSVRPEMVVDAGYVAGLSKGAVLIDSRAPERFRGDVEPLDWKAGHIPGAVNKNWADGLDGLGHWKSGVEQKARFEGVAEVVVYCGSGVSAGGNMLALELAGISGAKLYPGSWSDWITDESRPVAKS